MGSEEMSGKRSRTKGHSFERKMAAWFRKQGFPDARRHLEYQDGEANGVDLQNTGFFAVQCKKHKKYAPITCIREVQADDKIPLLVTAGDGLEPMVVIPLAGFQRLLKGCLLMGGNDEN